MPSKTTSSPNPPAEAVAKDAHWAAKTAKLERLRSRQRPTTKLTICDDPTVRRALDDARHRHLLATVKADGAPDDTAAQQALRDAEQRLSEAQAAFDEAAICLTFQALERPAFEALRRAHPPTEEQAEDGQIVNVASIAPELIAASSLDGITVDLAGEFLDTWAEAEAIQLFHAAWDVQSVIRADVGKG
ncbi:hypothetical protein [Streptomyces sp. DH12]|uniref:hypothetical protein n=1 Tax=Streptomyces sp. DH12 TaxID=2857010 RepID=UPI001E3CEA9C|nr:hypothetical protein [Streptomyces sp. DH12]